MTGLKATDALNPSHQRQHAMEARFLDRRERWRRDFREFVRDAGVIPADLERRRAADLEVLFEHLLVECANLAREPLLHHMSKITEAAAMLTPSPFMYPDPRKGAVAMGVDMAKGPDQTVRHYVLPDTMTPNLPAVLTRMVTDYLTPKPYAQRFDGTYPAGYVWHGAPSRDTAFINDVVHLVDNPQHVPPKEPGQ